MSLVLNMVGGGGGGLSTTDAILRVQAPAGSTVTISKGGISKSDNGHENAARPTIFDYYFIIHQSQFDSENAWTVSATRESESNSTTIVIDASNEYDVSISYHVPIDLYQEVEYLEATTTGNYVDIGFQPTGSTEFEITFLSNNRIGMSSGFGAIFGARTNYYTNGFVYSSYSENTASVRGHFLYGTATASSANNIRYDGRMVTGTKMTTTFHGGSLQSTAYSGATTIPSKTFTSPVNIILFGLRAQADGLGEYMVGRIYRADFWQNSSTKIRELYPCYRVSDSVAGMYDKINGVFYAGTGTFVLGADV